MTSSDTVNAAIHTSCAVAGDDVARQAARKSQAKRASRMSGLLALSSLATLVVVYAWLLGWLPHSAALAALAASALLTLPSSLAESRRFFRQVEK